jgi:carboxypeptidase PM20D1
MWHILTFLLIATIAILLGIAFIRMRLLKRKPNRQIGGLYQKSIPPVVRTEAAAHLSQLVRLQTVSHQNPDKDDDDEFRRFRETLKELYPLVHSKLTQKSMGDKNLVFIWEGSKPDLLPALLTAHQDVVPAGDESAWTHPPFSGEILDGYVWGRGSFDAKGQLTAILESIEGLLSIGFLPERTWWVAFGCDEEVRGNHGAASISKAMYRQGLKFAFVLDEGGAVAEGFFPGLQRPVAVIGIAEKGNLDLQLSCSRDGGHSSTPKNPTALGKIAAAVARIENRQPSGRFTYPIRSLFRALGKEAPLPMAMIFLNLWLFGPLLKLSLKRNSTTNALIRDTHATTMATGSEASNVISTVASAVINFRTLPQTTKEQVLDWAKKTIRDDSIQMEVLFHSPPSRVSDSGSKEFSMLEAAISKVFPSAITAPYLMLGGTDALWYEQVSDNVYRFTPALMNREELSRMHNANERFSLENLGKAIEFYVQLICMA